MSSKDLFFDAMNIPVVNLKTGRTYRLWRSDAIHFDHSRLQRIVEICNEPQILRHLAENGVASDSYSFRDATRFVERAKSGWVGGRFFVFFVLDPMGKPAGCLEIKSSDRTLAELGYWGSAGHSGIITPSVSALIELAREEGYVRLFANTGVKNSRSIKVLTSNGFIPDSSGKKEFRRLKRYIYTF